VLRITDQGPFPVTRPGMLAHPARPAEAPRGRIAEAGPRLGVSAAPWPRLVGTQIRGPIQGFRRCYIRCRDGLFRAGFGLVSGLISTRFRAHGGRSNVRTADSDSASLGSNPSPPATSYDQSDWPLDRRANAMKILAFCL